LIAAGVMPAELRPGRALRQAHAHAGLDGLAAARHRHARRRAIAQVVTLLEQLAMASLDRVLLPNHPLPDLRKRLAIIDDDEAVRLLGGGDARGEKRSEAGLHEGSLFHGQLSYRDLGRLDRARLRPSLRRAQESATDHGRGDHAEGERGIAGSPNLEIAGANGKCWNWRHGNGAGAATLSARSTRVVRPLRLGSAPDAAAHREPERPRGEARKPNQDLAVRRDDRFAPASIHGGYDLLGCDFGRYRSHDARVLRVRVIRHDCRLGGSRS
jgi:hypothetical protein